MWTLRAEFGTLYDDQLFADLYPPHGRPVEVAPWRLALVVVMQYIEGLTDRQAADAVRRCMDWKYALSLDLTDPGFDFTLLHDFRHRLLAHEAGQRLLDTFLAACKARGWVKARGTQRTDSTHVLAAIRTLHRLECVLEAMHYALNQLSEAAPAWVRQQVPLAWYTRYGLRSDQARLPKDASKREALARQIGADGYQLLDVGADCGHRPQASGSSPPWRRCGGFGSNSITAVRSRGSKRSAGAPATSNRPAAVRIASPYDLEARYSSKRDTHWVGYKVHLTETCDADQPDLITQVITTPATTQDSVMGPAIQHDLADRDLLPGTHLLDSGYVDADLLVTAQTPASDRCGGSAVWVLQPATAGRAKAMTCRPLSSIGRPSRRAVPKAIPVSTGGLDTMSRAIPSFASGLTGPPVARVPPAGRAPRRKAPHASSRSARKPTMRRSRPRANARRPPSSKPSMPCGRGWRAASRKGYDALISAGVGIWGWRARTSSSS